MIPVIVGSTATLLFDTDASVNERVFRVAKADDGGTDIRVARTEAGLANSGGTPYYVGEGEKIVGQDAYVGRSLYAITLSGSGTSKVYRDQE